MVVLIVGLLFLQITWTICTEAQSSTPKSHETKSDRCEEWPMYAAAGFMTAALVFSVGCFMTRYTTSKETHIIPERIRASNTAGHLLGVRQENEYSNDDHPSQQQVPGDDYCSIDRDHRMPYDTAGQDSRARHTIGNSNPYNRAVNDPDGTEYDLSSRVAHRTELWDPTYSHMTPSPTTENPQNLQGKVGVCAPLYSVVNKQHFRNPQNESGENETRASPDRNYLPNARMTLGKIQECDTENSYAFDNDTCMYGSSSCSEDSTTLEGSDEFSPSSPDETSEVGNTDSSISTSSLGGASVSSGSQFETNRPLPSTNIAVNKLYQGVSFEKGTSVLGIKFPMLEEDCES